MGERERDVKKETSVYKVDCGGEENEGFMENSLVF